MTCHRLLGSLLIASSLSLAACGGLRDPMLAGLPSAADLEISVPGQEGQALALGEISELYQVTRAVSQTLNGGIAGVFHLIERIVQHPPTVQEENRRVWGPSEPRGLERNSFRFTAERLEPGRFVYALEARPKGATEESDWQVVFDGEAFPTEDNLGHGTLGLYFDTMRALADECLEGTANLTYDLSSPARREVEVLFDEVANACNQEPRTFATYRYGENADDSGDFELSFDADIHSGEQDKPLKEHLLMKSRWLGTGAGRSDVILSDGEIPGDLAEHLPESGASTVRATECWDDGFGLVFSDTDPTELRDVVRPHLGSAESCAFLEADFPEPPSM